MIVVVPIISSSTVATLDLFCYSFEKFLIHRLLEIFNTKKKHNATMAILQYTHIWVVHQLTFIF